MIGASTQDATAHGVLLKAIADDTFKDNTEYQRAIDRIKHKQEHGEPDAAFHIVGLLSDKGVHHYDLGTLKPWRSNPPAAPPPVRTRPAGNPRS